MGEHFEYILEEAQSEETVDYFFIAFYLAHGSLMMVLYISMHANSVDLMYIFIDARLKVQQ